MQIDNIHVTSWNKFADDLYQYHKLMLEKHDIRTEEETGGYAGLPDFYNEIKYFDDKTGRLLSRIQWEIDKPEQIHVIEVFVYHPHGKLKSDYLAAYLPEFRNAPIQTLINVHYSNDELQSFRQFDASGAKIYEQCKGKFFDEPISINLEEDDFYSNNRHILQTLASEEYLTCFEFIPSIATPYFSPFKASGITNPKLAIQDIKLTEGLNLLNSTEDKLEKLNIAIANSANPGELFVDRGKILFSLHEFESAVEDYNRAIKINDNLDEAYFGRGMAKGRLGQVKQGIEDLSIYIKRHPASSLAYTKRGVRYIWDGDLDKAKQDLLTAIELNPNNAEAHDDLGVIYASKGDIKAAIKQFKKVVSIEPNYQKGFHNLAMSLQIVGDKKNALLNINTALNISPNNKNSILLKGEILKSMGLLNEAETLFEQAEFLPDGNWSERFSVK